MASFIFITLEMKKSTLALCLVVMSISCGTIKTIQHAPEPTKTEGPTKAIRIILDQVYSKDSTNQFISIKFINESNELFLNSKYEIISDTNIISVFNTTGIIDSILPKKTSEVLHEFNIKCSCFDYKKIFVQSSLKGIKSNSDTLLIKPNCNQPFTFIPYISTNKIRLNNKFQIQIPLQLYPANLFDSLIICKTTLNIYTPTDSTSLEEYNSYYIKKDKCFNYSFDLSKYKKYIKTETYFTVSICPTGKCNSFFSKYFKLEK